MDYSEKYQKYKIKYLDFENSGNNLIYKNLEYINNFINKFDKYYSLLNNINGGSNKHNSRSDEKLKKYKKFIKKAKDNVVYFKNAAEKYYKAYINTNNYYIFVLNQLKIKRNELMIVYNKMEKLGENNKNNMEKIKLLESMMTGLEKLTNNPVNIDNNIRSKSFKEKIGGTMDFEEFTQQVLLKNNELIEHSDELEKNKIFIEQKVSELSDRLQKIMDNDNILLKISSDVEYIVNELENGSIGTVEPDKLESLLQTVNNTIDEAKKKGNMDTKISDYIEKLNKYVHYLEEFIKSNDSALKSIDSKKVLSMDDYFKKYNNDEKPLPEIPVVRDPITQNQEETKTSEETKTPEIPRSTIGGKLNKRLFGGVNLEKFYDDKIKKTMDQYFEKIDNLKIIEIINYENFKNSALDYNKKIQIIEMLEMLDVLYNNYIAIRGIINTENSQDKEPEFKFLIGDELQQYNTVFLNKKIYNTNYYNNLLEENIYYFNTKESTKNQNKIKIKDALFSGLILYIKDSKLYINIAVDDDTYEKTISELENTIIFIYIVMKIYDIKILALPSEDEKIEKWKKMIKNIPKNNIKSVRMVNYYNKVGGNNNYNKKGGNLNIYKNFEYIENNFEPIQPEKIKEIIKENKISNYIAKEFMETRNKNIEKNQNIDPNDTISSNKTEINKLIELTIKKEKEKIKNYITSLDELIIKFTNKLGMKKNDKKESSKIDNAKYSEFIKIINTKEDASSIDNNKITSNNKRPRVDNYKNKLIKSVNTLQKFMENINYWNSIPEDLVKDNINNETEALFGIGEMLNNRIEEGLNSYISVLPIVFYACEFPTNIYENDNCYVTYKYNDNTELVSYTKKKECPPNSEISRYMNNTKDVKNYNYHAAFFNSNKKNNTINLINDKVIGLNKLIESTNEKDKAINKIINMMFLLGVSGTGKSTRVFGATDKKAAEGDKVGIVTNIIKKAILDGSTVSIGYFVCYGRKVGDSFKEMLLFFNKEGDGRDYFTPYMMEEKNEDNTDKYSNFYEKLANKKLKKKEYNTSLNFIKGSDNENINDIGYKKQTIRDILEESENEENIWTSVIKENNDIETNEKLTKLFDYYLNKQKEIYTVLPTKNNIESSRGHTCVLIRITDNEGNHKYFPLFDMAGKEDPEGMNNFFFNKNDSEKTQEQLDKTVKLILKINELGIKGDNVTGYVFDSNNNKIKNEKGKEIQTKINSLNNKNLIPLMGGLNIEEFTREYINFKNDNIVSKEFLLKIVNEGNYINHTIYMLIFMAMCIGKSINSEIIGEEDTFDNIGSEIFKQLQSNNGGLEPLFPINNYNDILNNSCIWSHVLFSFLYWNEETKESYENIIKDVLNGKTEFSKYLYNDKFNELTYYSDLTVKQAIEISGKINNDNNVFGIIKEKIDEISIDNDFSIILENSQFNCQILDSKLSEYDTDLNHNKGIINSKKKELEKLIIIKECYDKIIGNGNSSKLYISDILVHKFISLIFINYMIKNNILSSKINDNDKNNIKYMKKFINDNITQNKFKDDITNIDINKLNDVINDNNLINLFNSFTYKKLDSEISIDNIENFFKIFYGVNGLKNTCPQNYELISKDGDPLTIESSKVEQLTMENICIYIKRFNNRNNENEMDEFFRNTILNFTKSIINILSKYQDSMLREIPNNNKKIEDITTELSTLNEKLEKIKTDIDINKKMDEEIKKFINNDYIKIFGITKIIHNQDNSILFYKNDIEISQEYIEKIKNIKTDKEYSSMLLQIYRIMYSLQSAVKISLLHMITGQEIKFDMVIKFLDLVQNLYYSSNLIMYDVAQSGGKNKIKKYKIIMKK